MRKPGDVMWIIRPDWKNDLEIVGAVFVAENSECAILAPNPFGYAGSISRYLISDSRRNRGTEVYALPINEVYATRDEAGVALGRSLPARPQ